MKTKVILFFCVAIMALGLNTASAQKATLKTETFKVSGNCEMCQSTIEKAAKGVKGVSAASWNKDTKIIKVSYDSKVDVKTIHQAIANAGYETSLVKANEKSYAKLSPCCQYKKK